MLFRCAIELSVSSEHWAEVTYGPVLLEGVSQQILTEGDSAAAVDTIILGASNHVNELYWSARIGAWIRAVGAGSA